MTHPHVGWNGARLQAYIGTTETLTLEFKGMRALIADATKPKDERLREAAGEGRPYRAALLDMRMPGMDGDQTALAIRASAEAHLMNISQRQQQYLLDRRGSYASTVAALNVPTPTDVAALYTIAIATTAGPPPTFSASATPIAGKTQAKDLGGVALTIDNTGAKGPSGAW